MEASQEPCFGAEFVAFIVVSVGLGASIVLGTGASGATWTLSALVTVAEGVLSVG